MLEPKLNKGRFIKSKLPKNGKVGYSKNDAVTERHFGATLGIFNPKDKNILMLNPTAALIWNNIEEKRSLGNLVELIELSYGKNRDGEEIATEVAHTLKRFEKEGLIKEVKLQEPDKSKIAITEKSMTQLQVAFARPDLKVYTLEQIQKIGIGHSMFSDTWDGE